MSEIHTEPSPEQLDSQNYEVTTLKRTDFDMMQDFYLLAEKTGIDEQPETDEIKAYHKARHRVADFIMHNVDGSGEICKMFVIRDSSNRIVAGMEVRMGLYGEDFNQAYFCNQLVEPNLRRKGLASKLYEKAFEEAKQNACRRAFAFVKQHNIESYSALTKFGFSENPNPPPKTFEKPDDTFYMTKELL